VRFVPVDSDEVVGRTDVVARQLQREERIADADPAVLWLFTTRIAASLTTLQQLRW
jgi:hypothetical protein